MTAWIAFDRSDHAETTLAIELRCLKIMAFEHYELAASRFRLLFNPLHQPRTDTFSAHRFRHKQMPDVAGATPRPAIGAADHDTILVAKKEAVELPITDACRLHIEFVETIFERADRPGTSPPCTGESHLYDERPGLSRTAVAVTYHIGPKPAAAASGKCPIFAARTALPSARSTR